MKFIQIIISGLAASLAWFAGMNLVFGPAQGILSNPEFQSSKVLAVFFEIEPLPRMAGNTGVLISGLVIVGLFQSSVFSFLESRLHERSLIKGIHFGLISWALMIPWFEFYLLWNVLHEPLLLVLLETFLWLLVLQIVGVTLSFSSKFLKRLG